MKQPEFTAASLTALAEAAHYKCHKLASLLEMSPRTLRRRFLAQFGLPPKRALDILRLEAIRARVGAQEPLKSVAMETHFADAAHLAHYIRSKEGMTARQFALLATSPSPAPRRPRDI